MEVETRSNATRVGNLLLTHVGSRRYAQFPKLAAQAGLRHGFATRPMDVSARLDDRQRERAERRRQMAVDLNFDPHRLLHCVQVHEARIAVIDAPRAGGPLEGFDAVVTNQPGTPVMTFSADCPLVLVYDPATPALGLVHASWRCTVNSLGSSAIALMRERFGCRPERMLAGIGPSAGPEKYEVKDDVYEAARDLRDRDRFFRRRTGRMFYDLWQSNAAQIAGCGIPQANIELAAVCTMTDTGVFYSYRREGAGCGHFGLLAGLTPRG